MEPARRGVRENAGESVDSSRLSRAAMCVEAAARRRSDFSAGLLALLLAALAVGCSTLPERAWPRRVFGDLEVVYRFGPGSDSAVEVPQSDAQLTLFDLHTHTAGVVEEFRGDRRFWVVPAGTDELRIHCSYRNFALGSADPIDDAPDPDLLFPGATVIRHSASAEPSARL